MDGNGLTQDVEEPLAHSPTMPRTAVPCKVAIEPEPSTTTLFPEATGQMREG